MEKEGIGRASPLSHLGSSPQPPTSCRAGDGQSELGETWPKLILSADSQGLWERSFSVQWGRRSGMYSSGFQSLSQQELRTCTLGWAVRVCMLAQGDEDSGFNCVVPGARYTEAVDILNHRNALRRRREGLGLGTWHLALGVPAPAPPHLPASSGLLCSHLSVASLLLHPACFLTIFKDGQPRVVHEIFHTEGLQGFICWIRQEALFAHEQTKGPNR